MNLEGLPGWALEMFEEARVARLGLLDEEDRPRVLPVTFAPFESALWSAIEDGEGHRQHARPILLIEQSQARHSRLFEDFGGPGG